MAYLCFDNNSTRNWTASLMIDARQAENIRNELGAKSNQGAISDPTHPNHPGKNNATATNAPSPILSLLALLK